MSGDHNMYQKPRSYLDDFECPRCGHCCKTDLARVGEVGVWGKALEKEPLYWVYADDTSQERVDETAKQEHEPVAWIDQRIHGWPDCFVMQPDPPHTVPLYTAPPKCEWVGLTDDFVFELADTNLYDGGKNYGVLAFAKAIEQALQEKNT